MTAMPTEARDIAARLGVDEEAVRRLQARGYLLRFDLTRTEIRERLCRVALGNPAAAGGTRGASAGRPRPSDEGQRTAVVRRREPSSG